MTKPVILFACVHNGGRSLAAKVLAEHHGGDRVEVRSAGTEPGDSLNAVVVQVLQERGLSVEGEAPKLLTDEGVQESDVVITMGCGETCPVFPGRTYEDWRLDDPKGQDIDTVRRIVAEVDQRVQDLLARGVTVAAEQPAPPSPVPSCGCCGRAGRRLAELGSTPGVFICRTCALWAWRRARPSERR